MCLNKLLQNKYESSQSKSQLSNVVENEPEDPYSEVRILIGWSPAVSTQQPPTLSFVLEVMGAPASLFSISTHTYPCQHVCHTQTEG